MHNPYALLAEEIFELMRSNELIDYSRTGGTLVVLALINPLLPFRAMPIGSVDDPAKATAYQGFALEKAERLAAGCFGGGQVSSWQTKDEALERYAGAIRAGGLVFSFSGLPELADEALVLALAVRMTRLARQQAIDIARLSGNEIYPRLAEIMARTS